MGKQINSNQPRVNPAEKKIWSLWADKAKVVVAVIALLSLIVSVVALFRNKEKSGLSQQTTVTGTLAGNNNTQNISNINDNHTSNSHTQSPSIEGSTVSSNGNVNLGSQLNSGNSASGNSTQVIYSDNHPVTYNGSNFTTYNASNITIMQAPQPALPPPATNQPVPTDPKPVVPSVQPAAPPSLVPGGDGPGLNQAGRINFTPEMAHPGGLREFSFYQNVEQGDRLRFHIVPVNGAAMQMQLYVCLDQRKQRLESSGFKRGRLDWTMNKAIPGSRVRVQIISWEVGAMDVRVEKAK